MPKLINRKGIYQVEYFDRGKGFTTRLSLGTDDRKLAERKYAEWCLKNTDPTEGTLDTVTVEGCMGRFYVVAKDYPSSAIYKRALDLTVKHLRDIPLSQFKRGKQEWFVEQLRSEGFSEGYIKRLMAAISTAIKRAYDYDLIPVKPHVIAVTDDSRRDRTLSDDEARTLVKGVGDEEARRYVALALLTGARPGALIRLSKEQFDFSRHTLKLLPPGEKQVPKKLKPTIPLPTTLESMAQEWKSGRIFTVGEVRNIWSRLTKYVPDDVTPYVLRHTVATELRSQGVSEWDCAGYMGHAAPGSRTTARYAHYRPETMRAAAEAMDKYWARINKEQPNERRTDVGSGVAGSDGEGSEGGRREADSLEGVQLPP